MTFLHGQLARAQEQAEKGRQYFARRNQDWALRFQNLEAEILIRRGERNAQAISLLSAELPPSLTGTDIATNQALLLGIAYARVGNFRNSAANLDKAVSLCRVHCALSGVLARARGVVALQIGDVEKARIFFQESLEVARAQGDTALEASALLNLGVVASHDEHYDESIDWTRQAQSVAHANDLSFEEEKALGNLGWGYYRLGDLEQSLALYLEAEKRASSIDVTTDKVLWLTRIGDVYADLGRLTEAENSYHIALTIARQIDNPERRSVIANSLAFILLNTGRIDEAAKYTDEAFQMARVEQNRVDELYPILAMGEAALRRSKFDDAEKKFLKISRDQSSDAFLHWAAEDGLARLCEKKNLIEAEGHYRKALAVFEQARSSLHATEHKLPFLGNGVQLYDDYINFLLRKGEVQRALQVADFGRAQTLEEELGATKLERRFWGKLDPKRTALRAGGTILFYRLGAKQSYLWAITPKSVQVYELPPAQEIDAVLKKYTRGILALRDTLTMNEGVQLYNILVTPARPVIAHGSRVFVIPDGDLNTLNFETLVVPRPKRHYWIEDVSVIDGYSLKMLGAHRSLLQASTHKLLLLGDAVAPNAEYPELRNASAEMNSIGRHFAIDERQVLSGKLANPLAYLESHPQNFDYIHFVAHGTASRLDPLDSAIVLSSSGNGDRSFKLYARDIIKHPVQATLVTISTCYSAGSRAYTGEGLVGLSWAFLHAGAHNVVGALWQVSDDSTPHLMDLLYTGLRKGLAPESALRKAKLSIVNSDGAFRKPFYWAPFQLYAGL